MRSVATLQLDGKNPRLTGAPANATQRQLVQYLFQHYGAMDVAKSFARHGFFANEPLLAVQEGDRLVVVEGNRRLAALKALRDPNLLEGSQRKAIEGWAQRAVDLDALTKAPVIIAPNRRSTDRVLAARHADGLQIRWEEVNRARFIISKLDEGYTPEELQNELGFTAGQVKEARFFNNMVEVARSLDLDEDRKRVVASPGAGIFTTLERVLKSAPAKKYLHIQLDETAGFQVKAEEQEFLRGFRKVVEDIVDGNIDSRNVNDAASIEAYFQKWDPGLVPKGAGVAIPAVDLLPEPAAPVSTAPTAAKTPSSRGKAIGKSPVPRSFKPTMGSQKLLIIYNELTRLKRKEQRYASAVLLRVFLELAIIEYLDRHGKLKPLVARIQQGTRKLPFGLPPMQDLVKEIVAEAGTKLSKGDLKGVEKALRYDAAARFNVSELHAFVHGQDVPTDHDLEQFWIRTEPLFRMLLQ